MILDAFLIFFSDAAVIKFLIGAIIVTGVLIIVSDIAFKRM